MTLKQRVRYLTDGLARGAWLSFDDLRARETCVAVTTLRTTVNNMCRAGHLERHATKKSYRSGAVPVTIAKHGRPKREGPRAQLGFMALARLERTDPAAYRRAIAADRGRG